MQKNGPLGGLSSCLKNWCFSKELFFEWLLHFKQFARPSKDGPALMNGNPIKSSFEVLK
jgi:hypothetical protein